MKILKLYILFFLSCGQLFAQSTAEAFSNNIVPNPGFEMYASTPIGWFYKGKHFTSVMKYWNSATAASPDVFGPKVRVPAHWASKGFGEHKAYNGSSMAGLTAYGCENGKPHCREYIQIQLTEPLVPNQDYYAEFWVNHLDRSLRINSLGMYFSKDEIKVGVDIPLELMPQVVAENVVSTNGNNWQRISGEFKAEEASEFLIIGNFCPDSMTIAKVVNPNSLKYAYYYIDDVKVKKIEPIIAVPVEEDDLSRIEIKKGNVVHLKNIFFDTDKAELLPRSFVELKKLLKLMKGNPTMKIEISGHTDSTGDFDYNFSLSHKRAKAVVDYLNDQGIQYSRTIAKGFGSSRPIATNESDEGRQLNRRVEMLIVDE